MPAAKQAERYPTVYWQVIKTVMDKPSQPLVLPFENQAEASKFRAQLNYFRSALKHDSQRHPEKEVRSARAELFNFANKLRFKCAENEETKTWDVTIVMVEKDVSAAEKHVAALLHTLREDRERQELERIQSGNVHKLRSSSEDGGASLRGMFDKKD